MTPTVLTVRAEDDGVSLEVGSVGEHISLGEQHFADCFERRDQQSGVDAQSETDQVSVLLPDRVESKPGVLAVRGQQVEMADQGKGEGRGGVWPVSVVAAIRQRSVMGNRFPLRDRPSPELQSELSGRVLIYDPRGMP